MNSGSQLHRMRDGGSREGDRKVLRGPFCFMKRFVFVLRINSEPS
jgi:hypothetical protein